MQTIHGFPFPDQGNIDECDDWKPTTARLTLASRVMIVAATRVEGAWAAYCDAVPGICHDDEFREVFLSGDKLPASIAQTLFPLFAGLPYAD